MFLRTNSQKAALIIGVLVTGVGGLSWHYGRIGSVGGSLTIGVGSSILAAGIVAFLSPINEAGFRKFISLGFDDAWSSRRAVDERDWVDWVRKAKTFCVLLGIAHGNWCMDKGFPDAIRDRLEQGVEFKILFLNPNTKFAELRAREERGKRNDTIDVIRRSIETVWKIRESQAAGLQPRLLIYAYDGTPSCGLTWIDEFMVVTHYLARVPNSECPALVVRRPQGAVERCLYDTYAENLKKIINEASIRIDDTNIKEFLPQGSQGEGASQSIPQRREPSPPNPAAEGA